MTNYEMIKNQDIYAMALTIMCPYDLGFLDNYRCDSDRGGKCGSGDISKGYTRYKCIKCTLAWLEETSE